MTKFAIRLGVFGLVIALGNACSGASVAPDAGRLVPDAEAVVDASVDGAAEAAAPEEPDIAPLVGLESLTGAAFERLPFLHRSTRSARDTSYDRTGGNNDWTLAGNYLYVDANGDKVLVDTRGPGCVYRIWFTGFDPGQQIRFYFDGETTPRIETTLSALFHGDKAPFLAPLVGDETVSSGGFYSYLPLPFAKSLKVTASGSGAAYYFHFDYHLFDPDVAVTTWTGQEDSSAARALWSAAGADPKPAHPDEESLTGTVDIPANGAQTIADLAGPRQIAALRVAVPSALPTRDISFMDDGRAFTGESSFRLTIDPANDGVTLVRRLDYGIADQSAQIFVDGQPAGTWFDHGSDTVKRFRDRSFPIPANLTQGKSSIVVRVVRQPTSDDWNEFFYWAYSRVRGAEVASDTLDVGNAASESGHGYTFTQSTFAGARTYDYPAPRAVASNLDDLWIRITWDDGGTPSVEAPVGSFFAQGEFGPAESRGLAAGMSADGVMYMYFPMPFAKHAKVELVNKSGATMQGIWSDVRHRPWSDGFAAVGYFATAFHAITASEQGKDLVFLEASGAGHVVGIVESESGPKIRGYLEGDDRILVDERRTPMHGTGTEDIYAGGFYFSRGPFSLPLNGNPSHYVEGEEDGTSAYRFFVPDRVTFHRSVRFTVEHGPVDDVAVRAWTLAYYYSKPEARLTLSDTLKIGDAADEAAHRYTVTGQTFSGERTSTFEGEQDESALTFAGRAHKGESSFDLAVDPSNGGVVLRRLFDQHIGRQHARVIVDDTYVGDWYSPGANPTHAWREDEFAIPKSASVGKSALHLRIQFVSSDLDYNEFEYRAYSVTH
jgi:hypothetical protein